MATDKRKIAFGASAGIAATVATILGNLYVNEGWYSNNEKDRGGETTYGVTKVTAIQNGYTGAMKAFPKQCDDENPICADKIYYEQYITKVGYVPIVKADGFIAEELVDTAANMGPSYPSRWLQMAINAQCPESKLSTDGKIGQGTQVAFVACQQKIGKVAFCKATIAFLDARQKDRYNLIVTRNPSQKIFYRGWMNNRIGNVPVKKCESLPA